MPTISEVKPIDKRLGNDNGKVFLNNWVQHDIAKECGFGEGSSSYEKVIIAIRKTFALAQELKNQI